MRKSNAVYSSQRAKSRTIFASKSKKNPIHNHIMEFCNDEIKPAVYTLSSRATPQLDYRIRIRLKKILIIELVSVFEHYFKNMTAYYVDKNKVDLSILFEDDRITFKLSELDSILHDTARTKGDIIVSSLKFDGLNKVKSIVSKLLDIDFFKYLYEENTGNKYKMMVKGPPIDINYKNLYEAFELRHQVVHELKSVPYNYTKIVGLWDNVMNMFDIANTIFMIPSLLKEYRQLYGSYQNI